MLGSPDKDQRSKQYLLILVKDMVGVGTVSPTSMLHVAGRVKAQGYDTGDITYVKSRNEDHRGKQVELLPDLEGIPSRDLLATDTNGQAYGEI